MSFRFYDRLQGPSAAPSPSPPVSIDVAGETSFNLYQHEPPVEWPASTSPEALAALARECGAVHAPFEVAPGEWVIEGPVRGVARLRGLTGPSTLWFGRDAGERLVTGFVDKPRFDPKTSLLSPEWVQAQVALRLCMEYRVQRLNILPPGLAYTYPLSEGDVVREECEVEVVGARDIAPEAARAELDNVMRNIGAPAKPFPRANKAQLQRIYKAWPPPSQWLHGVPTAFELLSHGSAAVLCENTSYHSVTAMEVTEGPLPPDTVITIRGERYVRVRRKIVAAAALSEDGVEELFGAVDMAQCKRATWEFSLPDGSFSVSVASAMLPVVPSSVHSGLQTVPRTPPAGDGAVLSVQLARAPLYLAGWTADGRFTSFVSPAASVAEALTATAIKETMHLLARRVLVVLPASVRAGVPASQLPPRVSARRRASDLVGDGARFW
jgi:hypothetical protein